MSNSTQAPAEGEVTYCWRNIPSPSKTPTIFGQVSCVIGGGDDRVAVNRKGKNFVSRHLEAGRRRGTMYAAVLVTVGASALR